MYGECVIIRDMRYNFCKYVYQIIILFNRGYLSMFSNNDNKKKCIQSHSLVHDQDGEYYLTYASVTLFYDDNRFGFSVIGGVDEGFPPRIDDIMPGRSAQIYHRCFTGS